MAGEASFGPVSQVVRISIRTLSSRIDLVLPDRSTIAETLETVLELAPAVAARAGDRARRLDPAHRGRGGDPRLQHPARPGRRRRRHAVPDRHRRRGQRGRLRRRRRRGRRHRADRPVRAGRPAPAGPSRSARPGCSAALACLVAAVGRTALDRRRRHPRCHCACSARWPPACCPAGSATPASPCWPDCCRSRPAPRPPPSRPPGRPPAARSAPRNCCSARPRPRCSRPARRLLIGTRQVAFEAIVTGHGAALRRAGVLRHLRPVPGRRRRDRRRAGPGADAAGARPSPAAGQVRARPAAHHGR